MKHFAAESALYDRCIVMIDNENNGLRCEPENVVDGKRFKFLSLFRFGFPLMLCAWGIYQTYCAISFVGNSVRISAELTSPPTEETFISRTRWGYTGHPTYRCKYRFDVDGTTYVGSGNSTSLPNDNQIFVYYQTSNPVNNRVDVPDLREGLVWIALGTLGAFIASPQMWTVKSKQAHQLRGVPRNAPSMTSHSA